MFLQSNTTSIIIVYRPPQRKIDDFLHDFDELLGHMSCMSHHILIAGDFNIHIYNSSMDSATKCIQLLDQYNLQQHVNGATHTKRRTLDLVITKRDDSRPIIENVQIANCDISDHYYVFVSSICSTESSIRQNRKILKRNFEDVNIVELTDSLQAKLSCSCASSENIETCLENYFDNVESVLDNMCPKKEDKSKKRKSKPW